MKKIILLSLLCCLNAKAIEKDRGGGQVPYAKGPSSVMLSWNYEQSIVTLGGEAAKLLFNSLKVTAVKNTSLLAQKGEEILKEKGDIKCVSGAIEPVAYKCSIVIEN